MKYSIWAIPPEPVFSELNKIIADISVKYDSPKFISHMTLLGGIETKLEFLERATRKVAEKIEKLRIVSDNVSFSTTYYQSVFIRIKATAQLMDLNLALKEELKLENNVFMPHMSLIYGDHDMLIRENIASNIIIPKLDFLVSELSIISETPKPEDWKPDAVIPLG